MKSVQNAEGDVKAGRVRDCNDFIKELNVSEELFFDGPRAHYSF